MSRYLLACIFRVYHDYIYNLLCMRRLLCTSPLFGLCQDFYVQLLGAHYDYVQFLC